MQATLETVVDHYERSEPDIAYWESYYTRLTERMEEIADTPGGRSAASDPGGSA